MGCVSGGRVREGFEVYSNFKLLRGRVEALKWL